MLHTSCDAVAEWGEDHHGDMGILRLDVACHVEAIIIARTRHADDEVKGH